MNVKIIIISFSITFLLFLFQIHGEFNKKITERKYYNNLIFSFENNEKTNSGAMLIDYGGVSFFIKHKDDTNLNEVPYFENNKKTISKIENVNYENSKIKIGTYVNAPLFFPKDNNSIYKDLEKGVRVSPTAKLPHETGITFMEGHSGNNFSNSLNYSFFDNLSIYFEKIEYKTPIEIETNDYIFKYEIFNKEIIKPGEKEFYDSNFNHLILMTCYPRNTTQKRALIHGKLIEIIKK